MIDYPFNIIIHGSVVCYPAMEPAGRGLKIYFRDLKRTSKIQSDYSTNTPPLGGDIEPRSALV